MKHTPGPWKWHHRSEDQSHNGSVFSEMRTGMAYAVAMMPRYQEKEQWEADAHLIAAAPDLLEANAELLIAAERSLQYVIWAIHDSKERGVMQKTINIAERDLKMIQSAIAKAKS